MPSNLILPMAGVAAALAILTFSHVQAYYAGAASERQAMLTRSVEALRERNNVDEQIRTMDDRQLCLSLGGLPDECNRLPL